MGGLSSSFLFSLAERHEEIQKSGPSRLLCLSSPELFPVLTGLQLLLTSVSQLQGQASAEGRVAPPAAAGAERGERV